MPSPRVFISSTYVDLTDARSVVEHYFRELLFEPIAFERGGIHFDHTKPLDLSCYEAVKECDMMVLIIGGRYGMKSTRQQYGNGKSFNSITKTEYLEALSANIPIFTFIKQNVLNEYFIYINQPKSQRRKYVPKFVDNVLIFQLIKEIYDLKSNNLIIEYENVPEILQYLKRATADLVQNAIRTQRTSHDSNPLLRINAYKLFYYRRKKGLSHTDLHNLTLLNRQHLISLENIRTQEAAAKHGDIFRECTKEVIDKLELVLECKGQLSTGKDDDHLLIYIQYYHCNRGKMPITNSVEKRTQQKMIFPIKCVVFDFDGTLTKQKDRTTWELIWEELGYSIEDCARLHREFSNKAITHKEWCEKTCKAFNDRLITEKTLRKIASKIELTAGVQELLEILVENNIEMHMLSGSISQIINLVLGPLTNKFTNIQANSFKFTSNTLSYIESTDFDFEGKATYISNLLSLTEVSH